MQLAALSEARQYHVAQDKARLERYHNRHRTNRTGGVAMHGLVADVVLQIKVNKVAVCNYNCQASRHCIRLRCCAHAATELVTQSI
jgi:hypothetical protein